jgi:hypothetical protein
MNPRALVEYLAAKLNDNADTAARENGSSRDRTLDQYRYQAGIVAGLRQAATAIEDEYKRLLNDDDE